MGGEHAGKYIAYYRVSTQRQGRSGLGLEAQRQAVADHLNGGRWRIVTEYTEVESGKRKNRPKLAAALAACRVHGATLIIAKLDRLARNVAFVSNLMEAGIDFEAIDFPQANRLTIHILAAVAEHEARMISERTKAALAAAKRRGVKLGGVRDGHKPFTAKVTAMGTKARVANAQRRAADMQPIIAEVQVAGFRSLRRWRVTAPDADQPPGAGIHRRGRLCVRHSCRCRYCGVAGAACVGRRVPPTAPILSAAARPARLRSRR